MTAIELKYENLGYNTPSFFFAAYNKPNIERIPKATDKLKISEFTIAKEKNEISNKINEE